MDHIQSYLIAIRITDNSSPFSSKKKKKKQIVQYHETRSIPLRSTNRPRETSSFVIRKRVILTPHLLFPPPSKRSLATRRPTPPPPSA